MSSDGLHWAGLSETGGESRRRWRGKPMPHGGEHGGQPDLPLLPDAAWRQGFRRSLLAWYRRHARELPWRRTRDPYAIWVSEIMLQQTQVATVIGYYQRFLESFPNVRELAKADEQQVLRAWEGLGYYRRARQLHRAAREVVQRHRGMVPRDTEAIRALPGIGRYTAGAIASIAFDACEPILEANTIRLFSRLLALRGDPARPGAQRLLWEFSAALLPRRGAGRFNQALMELGSVVCSPREPDCPECPARRCCRAAAQGLQAAIPAPAKKPRYEQRLEAAAVIRRNGELLLRRCAPGERWGGLWDFPRFEVSTHEVSGLVREMADGVRKRTGVDVEIGRRLAVIRHGVTRFRITLACHEASWLSGEACGDHLAWVPAARLARYPLSTTGRKLAGLVD